MVVVAWVVVVVVLVAVFFLLVVERPWRREVAVEGKRRRAVEGRGALRKLGLGEEQGAGGCLVGGRRGLWASGLRLRLGVSGEGSGREGRGSARESSAPWGGQKKARPGGGRVPRGRGPRPDREGASRPPDGLETAARHTGRRGSGLLES